MSVREVRVEQLLGRRVLAQNGRPVGRVEEIRVERSGAGYSVTEYHVGSEALLERLAVGFQSFFRKPPRKGYAIAWDQVDLSDPESPRLTCPADQLRRLGPEDEQEEPGAAEPKRRSPKGEG
jgi:sporulation protein YlmC with PRC-barrel domain